MSYTEARKAIAEQSSTARCLTCGTSADPSTLSSYGGRCGGCYAAYCRTIPDGREPSLYARSLAAKQQHGTDPDRIPGEDDE